MDYERLRAIDWRLLFIRTYTMLSTMYSVVTSQTIKSVRYLTASFAPEHYVFFKGSTVPVTLTDYKKDLAGTSTIEFYYDREQKTIRKGLDISYIPRTLNIDGASIYHGDICLYDLSNFFDTTRYAGVNDVPTLDQWVGIWQLEQGIYLDRTKGFQIHIDFLGESKEVFELWGGTSRRWVELTSNTPRLHTQVLNLPTCSCPSPEPPPCPCPCPPPPCPCSPPPCPCSCPTTPCPSPSYCDLSVNTTAVDTRQVEELNEEDFLVET